MSKAMDSFVYCRVVIIMVIYVLGPFNCFNKHNVVVYSNYPVTLVAFLFYIIAETTERMLCDAF